MKSFRVHELYEAMEQGNTEHVEEILNGQFLSALSFYDTAEAFYHGILITLLQLNRDFVCSGNRESGSGRFDVLGSHKLRRELAFICEVRIFDKEKYMLRDAQRGAGQARIKRHATELEREGYKKIVTFGISFFEKRCRVVQGQTYGCP